MLANADITIYNKRYNRATRLDEWRRTQIRGVEWYGGHAVTVSDKGLQTADIYTVRIPVSAAPPGRQYALPEDYAGAQSGASWTIQNGDIVVRGLITDEISKAADLTAKYSQCFTVTGWRDNRRGSTLLQHWRIDGK